MAISLASLRRSGEEKKPARLLFHAVQGVGKTTFASQAPHPVFVPCEDGLASVDVDAFPLARSYSDVMEALASLYTEDHAFESVVLDSLDWLEPLIHAEVCQRNGWNNIEEPGYGKGFAAALNLWREYFDGVDALRNDKNMWVIQIAHTDVKKFSPPDGEPYDRYRIKLNEKAAAICLEHSDAVMFGNYVISTTAADSADKSNKKVRAVGGGQRVVYTAERPAFIAKNRYSLPEKIMVPNNDWSPVWEALHAAVGI